MIAKISRRKIAEYVAERIASNADVSGLIDQVAAYLIESRRTREVELVVRAIEDALDARGIVVASVTSARALDDSVQAAIEKRIHAERLHVREIIDPNLVGGLIIETPGKKLDVSIRSKLNALRGAKI